ncbi:MAG: SPOR domain-containing protein [Rhodospirillales bacterium]|nr:SPOR domain-containing protein [Rhodospirillales bacterium]
MSDPLFFDHKSSHTARLKEKVRSANPYIIGFLSFAMILVIAASIWVFYPSENSDPNTLPVVRASTEPLRMKPDGDQETASAQDSYIYRTFSDSSAHGQRIENLLKPQENSEEPVSRDELFAGLKPEMQVRMPEEAPASITESPFPDSNAAEDTLSAAAETPEPSSAQDITTPVQLAGKKDAPGIFATVPETPEEVKKIETLDKMEPAAGAATYLPESAPPALSTSKTGTHYVQLASIQDAAKATDAWKDLVKKHNILQGINYRTQNATIPGRGVYTRIQAGPFSKDQATSLCNKIKAASGTCLVVSR